ncbi:MAG: protein-L-isoaspartate(D-aspartate) O-methyltransferase [Bacteroidales bacterium]|jgi:protein-L-isoaspartate(D-aspartate) O-methyltransferase|nr:protein-L-isoaspartate(D-aspartate) O-methyltransferase [Bacteroidales bacterium]MCK9449810.1 protein-L-isoaspartate(D-aspartate) O-methyltransferase [Bacteroidales bacterium]MDD3701422.1 protein-L-isoaspartate(D-aspartate) O-methyltransferase [Bacteroidales bacterium]MDY0369503.1 protein-L-isoaspartate(D-aspartate) O-methyltransferase [Bacteroidales bacterium]
MKWLSILLGTLIVSSPLYAQNFDQKRAAMVQNQLRQRGIVQTNVLEAFQKVERHLFVPAAYTSMAYSDGPLPIGYGQTISQPYIVAYMTQLVNPKPNGKVLEIGTGSGYQAAILAEIVEKVYTIEIIPELGKSATDRLKELGYQNIEVITADGYHGLEEQAPFDAIVVTAAAEHIPPSLIQQLKEGGKMIIPVGSPFLVQTLMLVEKKAKKVTTKSLMPVRFVPFTRSQEK